MKLIAIAAVSAMLLATGAAQAQMARGAYGNVYGEVGYSQLKIQESNVNVRPGMLRGIIGFNLHPNVAVEGLAGFGVVKDDANATVGGVTANFEGDVQHMFGIYVKPKVLLGPGFELFGRLGYTDTRLRTRARVTGLSVEDTSSGSDWSYGLGANFNVGPQTYLGLDYMRFYDKNNTKLDGLTFSVGYRF